MISSLAICWRCLRRLRATQLALLALIIALGFGVTGAFYANYRQAIDSETGALRATLERTAQLLGERIGESVLFENIPQIQRQLQLIETLPAVERVFVQDRNGERMLEARNRDYALEYGRLSRPAVDLTQPGFHGEFPNLGYTAPITLNARTVGTVSLFNNEKRLEQATSERFWQFMLESFLLWCVLGVFGSYLVIQTRFENRLRRQVQTDPVTGELSRYGLNDLYGDDERFRHHALLLIDLYDMKAINAGHGVPTGDRILQLIARTLRATLGPRAGIARLDGDDFAILVPATQWASVRQIGQSVATAVHSLRFDEIEDLDKVSICGGAVILEPSGCLSQRLSEADLAMRHAKTRAWKSIVCADEAFIAESQSAGAFVTDLEIRQGLRNGEFGYYLQPLINVTTGETIGFESLIRWTRGDQVRSPAVFLDRFREIIKDDDYYAYVTRMRRALTQRVAQSSAKVLSFNIGLEDLQNLEHPEQLAYDFGADCPGAPQIIIEVTERGLPQHLGDDLTGLRVAWEGLRSEQTVLALDDFGALESNLYRLRELDINYVKIDKALIMTVPEDAKSRAIVQSIAGLCKALDIEVVAEGIESEAQCRMVADLGIVIQQGFYLGRPQQPAYYLVTEGTEPA